MLSRKVDECKPLVVGSTGGLSHDLVIWRYNPNAAFRVLEAGAHTRSHFRST